MHTMKVVALVAVVLAGAGVAAAVPIDSDFGDAPDSYQTLWVSNGAEHEILAGMFLGASVDSELDGQPHPLALGDDLNGVPDDEDGVIFTSMIWPGFLVNLTVTASTPGLLNAWLDFNANGTWADAGEQIFTDQALVAGANALSFSIPITASYADTYARFRFSSQAGLPWYGTAIDGEVEDYHVELPEPASLGLLGLGAAGLLRRRR